MSLVRRNDDKSGKRHIDSIQIALEQNIKTNHALKLKPQFIWHNSHTYFRRYVNVRLETLEFIKCLLTNVYFNCYLVSNEHRTNFFTSIEISMVQVAR